MRFCLLQQQVNIDFHALEQLAQNAARNPDPNMVCYTAQHDAVFTYSKQ
jgi:hypothetical protein